MKKLLVLMLVLGLASVANAAISLVGPTTINEGDTVSIGIDNSDGLDYGMYLSVSNISEGGFSMGTLALTSLAGDTASIGASYTYDDTWEVEMFLANSVGNTTPGIQITADLTCLLEGIFVTVDLWDGADLSAPVDTLVIEQVPEPMTVALLGLGGLFLLRRRK